MNKNYIEYNIKHWSKIKDSELALSKYLNNYKDIYNIINIEKILNVISNEKKLKILDYGGGIGFLSVKLAQLGHDVTLADQSEEALKTASLYFSKQKLDINILRAKDGYFLWDNKYDIIIAKDLIEHVIEDEKMFKDLFEILNNNGKIIITTQNSFSLNYLIEGTYKKIKSPKNKWLGWDRTHIRFYTPITLKKLCKNLDVKSIKFESSYIFPYKMIDIILFKLFKIKRTKFYLVDKLLMKTKLFGKYGWNIMMICQKN